MCLSVCLSVCSWTPVCMFIWLKWSRSDFAFAEQWINSDAAWRHSWQPPTSIVYTIATAAAAAALWFTCKAPFTPSASNASTRSVWTGLNPLAFPHLAASLLVQLSLTDDAVVSHRKYADCHYVTLWCVTRKCLRQSTVEMVLFLILDTSHNQHPISGVSSV